MGLENVLYSWEPAVRLVQDSGGKEKVTSSLLLMPDNIKEPVAGSAGGFVDLQGGVWKHLP